MLGIITTLAEWVMEITSFFIKNLVHFAQIAPYELEGEVLFNIPEGTS
jgi:hypothetical protein